MAVSDIQTHITAAKAAYLSGDYAGAEEQLVAAEMELAVLPDSQIGSSSVRWRDAIQHLRQHIARKAGSAGRVVHADLRGFRD